MTRCNPINPIITTTKSETKRFSVGSLLAVTLFVAVVCAGGRSFGASGIAPACGFVSATWFAISRTKTSSLYPINRQRMTVVELLTILAICFILHGLTFPAVQSGPHKRRPIPATPAPATQSTNSNPFNLDGDP
jgi:hypothetical protein